MLFFQSALVYALLSSLSLAKCRAARLRSSAVHADLLIITFADVEDSKSEARSGLCALFFNVEAFSCVFPVVRVGVVRDVACSFLVRLLFA